MTTVLEKKIDKRAETKSLLFRLKRHPFNATKIEQICKMPKGIMALVNGGHRNFTEAQIHALDAFLKQYE